MYSVTNAYPMFVRNILELITALDNIDLVQAATSINAERPFRLEVRDTNPEIDTDLEWTNVDYTSLELYDRAGEVIFFYAGEKPKEIMQNDTGEWCELSLPSLLISHSGDQVQITELEIDTDLGTHDATLYYGSEGRAVDTVPLVTIDAIDFTISPF